MKPGVSLVKIFDGQGGSFTNPVEIAVDSKGFLLCLCTLLSDSGKPRGDQCTIR